MNMLEKLDRAIDILGEKWVFHQARAVKRIPPAQQIQMHKSDIAATFRKEYARLAAMDKAP